MEGESCSMRKIYSRSEYGVASPLARDPIATALKSHGGCSIKLVTLSEMMFSTSVIIAFVQLREISYTDDTNLVISLLSLSQSVENCCATLSACFNKTLVFERIDFSCSTRPFDVFCCSSNVTQLFSLK